MHLKATTKLINHFLNVWVCHLALTMPSPCPNPLSGPCQPVRPNLDPFLRHEQPTLALARRRWRTSVYMTHCGIYQKLDNGNFSKTEELLKKIEGVFLV